ncbi:hypothetical protein D6779_07720 [Candidatus Parcubacteria bacterium]|nr:MAG: hypothetical protein D6779_07720 [Candidatus Parcubacteria bacterium]
MKEKWITAVLVIFLTGVIALDVKTAGKVQYLLRKTFRALPPPTSISPHEELVALKSEVAHLKGMLGQITPAPPTEEKFIIASVFSSYPFGIKSKFLIDKGARDGIEKGFPVLFHNFLIGSIADVFDATAVVETIFHTTWQSAVGIGDDMQEGLLVGGIKPQITLIAKSATVQEGDVVFNTAQGFPFAAPLGTIQQLRTSKDGLFFEADLSIPYQPSGVRQVVIVQRHFQRKEQL